MDFYVSISLTWSITEIIVLNFSGWEMRISFFIIILYLIISHHAIMILILYGGIEMRKVIGILVSMILACALFACGNAENTYDITAHDWNISVIQSNTNGDIVFCSEDVKKEYPTAEVTSLTCEAGAASIILSDGKDTWELKYKIIKTTPESILYEIIYGEAGSEVVGNAVSSVTKYADNISEYTFIISIGEYSLHFVSNT